MNILGISCFYHDSAACLLIDGKIVAAAQEERFNRNKNSSVFPLNAINFCIQKAGLSTCDIDYIGFYEKPFLKFSRVVISHIKAYPRSLSHFLHTLPFWLEDRLIMPLVFKREIGFEGECLFIKHHLSHAASAFLVSGFEESAILTADGVGEWATTTYGVGRGSDIKILKEILFPNSLGLLYTAVTTYLGFEALEGEGKVMGLAAFGEPRYLDSFKKIITVKDDGSFRLDQSFFGFFHEGARMYNRKFLKLFGKERKKDDPLEDRHRDIAASLQKLTEEILIKIARSINNETKLDTLCLAGGLFLNCVANNKILEESGFKQLFVQPAAGDSGGALGVATYIYHSIFKNARAFRMADAYLGPEFSANQIKRALSNNNLTFRELPEKDLCKNVATQLAHNKIVGWFQGRMEFGPRALGNRSILANPCNPGMKDLLNLKVKKRESFRPYAPVVLEEKAHEYFRLSAFSPFMLLAPLVKDDKRQRIPAVTHIDGSARVQTVNKDSNPRLWSLISEFEKITGVPMIINTSFNLKSEPIVCSPQDAIDAFQKSQMDCLVLENFLVERNR